MKSKPNPHAAALRRLDRAVEAMRVRETQLANATAKVRSMADKLRREMGGEPPKVVPITIIHPCGGFERGYGVVDGNILTITDASGKLVKSGGGREKR